MRPQSNFDWYRLLTILMIIVGVGFFLVSLILSRVVFNEKDRGTLKEDVVPGLRSQGEQPVEASVPQKDAAPTKPKRTTLSTETSGFVHDAHQHDPHQDKKQLDDTQAETAEEVAILDENDFIDENGKVTDWEKWKLARMHKNGWFKPEDVPIIYGKPVELPDRPPPDGIYMWTKYKPGGGLDFEEAPEHVKARDKVLKEEQDRAVARGDAREVNRIARELGELHRPYKKYPSGVLNMHAGSIPDSWQPYFDDVFESEKQAFHEELQRLLSKVIR